MKAHKIKNMSKTDAKVLLFFILAVTLGFANACRSGGGDNKGDNMNPGDTITDTAAVQRAKDALMIRYAPGDRAESVTQNVSLPTSGANGVSISWESSDAARISTTGTVSRSDDMDTEVILTATLTKNAARDTRRFILTVTLPYGTTSELVTKLQAMPPSLSGCSAASIRGANMTNLVSAGVTKEQLLAVWSADQDTGFTSAQLKAAGVTVAEMQAASLTISQIYTGGVSIADLLSAGLTITQLDTGVFPTTRSSMRLVIRRRQAVPRLTPRLR